MFPSRSTVTRLSRVGEILGGEPEVERMPGDVVERETGHEPGRAGAQDVGV